MFHSSIPHMPHCLNAAAHFLAANRPRHLHMLVAPPVVCHAHQHCDFCNTWASFMVLEGLTHVHDHLQTGSSLVVRNAFDVRCHCAT